MTLLSNASYSQVSLTDSIRTLLRKTDTPDTTKAKIYNTLAKGFTPNYPDSIIYYAKKGAVLVKNNLIWESNLINTAGVGFFYKSEYDSAFCYYLIALKLREKSGNEKLISSSYNNVAVILQIKGETKKAMEYYFKNLKFREKINDLKGIANVCDNIGNLYNEQLDGRMALTYQMRSIKIRQDLNDTLSVAFIKLNMSNSYDNLNKPDSVYYYLKSSLPILINNNQLNSLGQAYNGLGTYYAKKKNSSLALTYFLKSKEYYEKVKDIANASFELVNIGMAKIDLSDFKGALKDCNEALPTILNANYFEKLKYCYKCLYKANKALNNNKEALDYHEKLSVIKDSLNNQEKTKELTRIVLNHEYNIKTGISDLQRQKEIELSDREKKNQKNIIYFIIIILLISVFLIFFVINRLKITNKQNIIIQDQKKDVELQKEIIEEKHKEITDSINYAERIQRSFLASKDLLNENLNEYFVFFQPKDIVSGDFYWASKLNNGHFVLVTADSTGHGVPGAIMSIINISCLEKAVEEQKFTEPNDILNHTRIKIIERLKKDGSAEGGKDGMDCSLISFDFKSCKLSYAAANNPIWIVRSNQLLEFVPDKMPVGKHDKDTISFTQHNIDLQTGDVVYALTDGLPDQFGGPKGKKFMYKQLKDLLISIAQLPMTEQHHLLKTALNDWKGTFEQVDDVCIIGMRI